MTQVTLAIVNFSPLGMFSTPKESWEPKQSFDAYWVSRKLASGIFNILSAIVKIHSIWMEEAGPPLV